MLEIHAPGSHLEYGGSAVEIQSWGSLGVLVQESPEAMSESEVRVDDKLERMAHTLLVQRAANDVVRPAHPGSRTDFVALAI